MDEQVIANEPLDDAIDNAPVEEASKDTDSYLDEMVAESDDEDTDQDPEFDKNEEGVTGDEWKEDEAKKSLDEIKEQNRKNAERRIKNKQKRQQEEQESEDEDEETQEPQRLEDDQLDAESARVYKERFETADQFIRDNAETLKVVHDLGLDPQKIQMGNQFVEKWSRDPIALTKELLTYLEGRGIDISQIYDHQVDDTQMRIDAEVNRRMQPIVQERMQVQAQQQARQVLDNFLGRYPDAEEHLGEIVEVMRRANLRDPYDAYDRLRRVYAKNNISWFGDDEPAEEVPQLGSRSRIPVQEDRQPTSSLDLVRMNAKRYFNGES